MVEIDEDLEEGTVVSPTPPWEGDTVLVSVISEPTAYGHATHGFAGRVEIRINRYTSKVAAIVRLKGGTCDPPNIQISESEAKRTAEQAWARRGDDRQGVKVKMNLQYYVPDGDEATPQGLFYRSRNRVRLCWVAAYYLDLRGPNGDGPIKPIGDVAIDSETGELLSVPD